MFICKRPLHDTGYRILHVSHVLGSGGGYLQVEGDVTTDGSGGGRSKFKLVMETKISASCFGLVWPKLPVERPQWIVAV